MTTKDQIASLMNCLFEPDDLIEIRLLKSGKSSWHKASDIADQTAKLKVSNKAGQDVYFGANPRHTQGGKAEHVSRARCLFADFDNTDVDSVRERLAMTGFPEPTVIVNSGHGVHCYWRLDEPMKDLARWCQIQKRLLRLLGSDPKVCDAPRIMRLPGFINHKEPVAPAELMEAHPDRRYTLADLESFLPAGEEAIEEETDRQKTQKQAGNENSANFGGISGEPVDSDIEKRAIAYLNELEPSISGQRGHDKCLAAARAVVRGFNLGAEKGFQLLSSNFNHRCEPPWSEKELRHKCEEADTVPFDKPRGYLLAHNTHESHCAVALPVKHRHTKAWPTLDDAAYHGPAGRTVIDIGPHSEADPVALLVQLLVGFGSVIGRTAHFKAEGTCHYLNLFAVMAGDTSKARKGTSWGRVRQFLGQLDATWFEKRVTGGLVSGPGLVHHVRDPVSKREPIKEKGRIIGYENVIEDEGEPDKRLLCVEEEYASVIGAMGRPGNDLSAIMRQAWQGQPLGGLTKNSTTRCNEPHISVIGHTTIEEITRLLSATEMANGWGNRHLWACIKRSKLLPEGSTYLPSGLLLSELSAAANFAKNCGELKRDKEAREFWREIYGDLSEGKPGLVGAMAARAEAQVMRLACLYAVLDQSPLIQMVHLQAGLALWRYCEQSVRYIFGDSTGDQTADEILRSLRAAGTSGMTRVAISHIFSRNRKSEEIGRALTFLHGHRLVRMTTQETGGRPSEVWHAV